MAIFLRTGMIPSKHQLKQEGGDILNENVALTEAVYYILLSLYHPQHGYGIMQQAEQMSGGRVRLAAGTLYGALSSLSDKGWIEALPGDENSRRKEYRLTEKGLDVLEAELARLQQLVQNGIEVLRYQVP
jgi:DNA-binding PadR family transcriptional regulator